MKLGQRKHERKVPDRLVFCQIDGDDGGEVLNISEGGLCVKTFALVPQKEVLHFWFSLDLKRRIEAKGKVAWVDPTGKVAGLSFVDLSVHARERIRAWIAEAGVEKSAGEPAPVYARAEASAMVSAEARPEVQPTMELARTRWPLGLMRPTRSISMARKQRGSGAAVTLKVSRVKGLIAIRPYEAATHGRFLRRISAVIVICVVAGAALLKHSDSGKQSGSAQGTTTPAAKLSPQTQDGTTVSIPKSELRQGSFVPTTARRPDRSNGLDPSGYSAGSRAEAKRASESPKVKATPEQLWASVETGNSEAAVALADRYLRGDGVPVNCEQARVLLLVASQKNNTEAIKKLRDLDETGCPANPQ